MIVRVRTDISEELPHGLTPGRFYRVLAIGADSYRLLSDSDSPVLFDTDLFDVIDPAIPATWTREFGEDAELYAGPADHPKYVWEDYHDDVPEAVRIVNEYLALLRQSGPLRWDD